MYGSGLSDLFERPGPPILFCLFKRDDSDSETSLCSRAKNMKCLNDVFKCGGKLTEAIATEIVWC